MQMCHRWAWHERESGVRVGRPKQTKVDAEFEEEFFFGFLFQVYADGIERHSSRTKLFEGWFQEENCTFSWGSKGPAWYVWYRSYIHISCVGFPGNKRANFGLWITYIGTL